MITSEVILEGYHQIKTARDFDPLQGHMGDAKLLWEPICKGIFRRGPKAVDAPEELLTAQNPEKKTKFYHRKKNCTIIKI